MNSTSLLKRTLALVAMTSFASLAANADVITYSTGFSLNNTGTYTYTYGSSFNDSDTNYGYQTLSRFDPLMGVLTGVEVSFTSTFSHSTYAYARDTNREFNDRHCNWLGYNCDYYYNNDTWVTSTAENSLSIVMTDPNLGGQSTTDYNYNADCSRSYYHVRNGGSVSCSNSDNDPNNPFNSTLFSGMNAAFVGTDPLNFTLRNYARVWGSCDNNDYGDYCDASTDSYWGGTIQVRYTFDRHQAVPEPSTLALLGLGLVGVGFARRRKNRA